jgi:hypothetical protein
MDKLITERDEEAIDADLKGMVEAAQRAEARNAKPAVSPLHEVQQFLACANACLFPAAPVQCRCRRCRLSYAGGGMQQPISYQCHQVGT